MANTALKKVSARQYPLVAQITLDYTNLLDTATAVTAIALPPNSQIIGGDLVVDTAFNSGTSITLAVGDSGVANRYLAATSIAATGRTALTPTGYVNVGGLDIQVTPTIVGAAATAGSARLTVQYVIQNRGNEAQVA